ncbi:gastric inhibitory polypeptide [Acanthochromis polyacanthus]|uniref:gastric inhibitory polypeptide n=1 Tax=Acanthochromis polyacanthus TaxID=80966 RepID=UPI0022340030|nr:gastric inhibitory polypeptide [Acanthochromis polyacanthus]
MKTLMIKLLVIFMLGGLHANTQTEEMGFNEDEQHLRRRYAESVIASEISKIRDSMVQRNFINFLLSQKGKRSRSAAVEEDQEERWYNDLLKLSLHDKQGNI